MNCYWCSENTCQLLLCSQYADWWINCLIALWCSTSHFWNQNFLDVNYIILDICSRLGPNSFEAIDEINLVCAICIYTCNTRKNVDTYHDGAAHKSKPKGNKSILRQKNILLQSTETHGQQQICQRLGAHRWQRSGYYTLHHQNNWWLIPASYLFKTYLILAVGFIIFRRLIKIERRCRT